MDDDIKELESNTKSTCSLLQDHQIDNKILNDDVLPACVTLAEDDFVHAGIIVNESDLVFANENGRSWDSQLSDSQHTTSVTNDRNEPLDSVKNCQEREEEVVSRRNTSSCQALAIP